MVLNRTDWTRGEKEVGALAEKGATRDVAGAGMRADVTDTDTMRGTRLGVIGDIDQGPGTDICKTGHNLEAVKGGGMMIDTHGRVQRGVIHLSVGEDGIENITMRGKDRRYLDPVVSLIAFA